MESDTLAALADRGIDRLNEYESRQILREYDVPCPDEIMLEFAAGKAGNEYLDAYEAASAAPEFPLYLKVAARDVSSVSDIGGVEQVGSRQEFAAAIDRMIDRVTGPETAAAIQGILAVEDVSERARELLLGSTVDPQFGPVVSLGVGGIYVEVYRDVEFRVLPIEAADVRSMLRNLDGRDLLGEFRGMPPVDEEAIVDAVLSFSRMIRENPAIAEADVNPLMARPDGVVAADALLRID